MAFTSFSLGDVLYSFIGHFTLSFIAGAATWISISYVLRAFDSFCHTSDQKLGIITKFIIDHRQLFLLMLSVAVALIAHTLEDYYFYYF